MTAPPTGDRDTWQVPDVAPLRSLRASPPGWVESLVHPRRALGTVLLLPLTSWAARSSLPVDLVPGPAWWVVLATVGLLAAATLASYVPLPRGAPRSAGGPCARGAVFFVVLSFLVLGSATTEVVTAAPALLLVAMGLGQRLVGATACGPLGR